MKISCNDLTGRATHENERHHVICHLIFFGRIILLCPFLAASHVDHQLITIRSLSRTDSDSRGGASAVRACRERAAGSGC